MAEVLENTCQSRKRTTTDQRNLHQLQTSKVPKGFDNRLVRTQEYTSHFL